MGTPRKITLWAVFALLVFLIIGGAFFIERAPRFYPYVVFEPTEAFQISFIQEAKIDQTWDKVVAIPSPYQWAPGTRRLLYFKKFSRTRILTPVSFLLRRIRVSGSARP